MNWLQTKTIKLFDKFLEWSVQRNANKQFRKRYKY